MKQFLARALLAITLALAAVVLIGAPAQAAQFAAAAAVFSFSLPLPLVIALVVSTVLPLLVGLVTRSKTSHALKATLLALLAAATGFFTELGASLNAGQPYDFGVGLLTALGAFLLAVGLHFGLFKPLGVSAALQRVGDPAAN